MRASSRSRSGSSRSRGERRIEGPFDRRGGKKNEAVERRTSSIFLRRFFFLSPSLERSKLAFRFGTSVCLSFFFFYMQILVRVALPTAARERGESGSSSRTASNADAAAPTSSSHSLVAVDFSRSSSCSSSSPSPSSLASIAERALREAGHPHAHRALASGEWRAVFLEAAGGIDGCGIWSSETAATTPLLSVAPSALSGGKGGFGSLLRASGRVAKVTDQGACRDLSGRRLKHVEQERAAAEWLAAAPARAEAWAAKKRAAEEARKKATERIAQEAEASVDAKALKEAQESAARETAAAVAEAEAQGRRKEVGAPVANGRGIVAAAVEGEEQQPEANQDKKKKKKNALDALAGLSGDDESDEGSSDSDDE